uniref:ARAD1C07150p n=1 Tax=Blastobotrys adeninivorans TaxID=409370 RepID=A0A060SZV6_BLAAD
MALKLTKKPLAPLSQAELNHKGGLNRLQGGPQNGQNGSVPKELRDKPTKTCLRKPGSQENSPRKTVRYEAGVKFEEARPTARAWELAMPQPPGIEWDSTSIKDRPPTPRVEEDMEVMSIASSSDWYEVDSRDKEPLYLLEWRLPPSKAYTKMVQDYRSNKGSAIYYHRSLRQYAQQLEAAVIHLETEVESWAQAYREATQIIQAEHKLRSLIQEKAASLSLRLRLAKAKVRGHNIQIQSMNERYKKKLAELSPVSAHTASAGDSAGDAPPFTTTYREYHHLDIVGLTPP